MAKNYNSCCTKLKRGKTGSVSLKRKTCSFVHGQYIKMLQQNNENNE